MLLRKRIALLLATLLIFFAIATQASSAGSLLTVGSTGKAVKEVQTALKAAGFDPGPADGIFGPKTLTAVRGFQQSRGLVVDGVVGPQTLAALKGTTVSRGGSRGPLAGKRIVVDPGHGGPNPGALAADGSREADNVLAISLRLRDLLVSAGAEVIMTRSADVEPKSPVDPGAHQLKARTDIANRAGGHLFVSVHNNAYPQNPGVRGVMTFSRYQDATSKRMSTIINDELKRSMGWESRGVMEEGFYVLRNTSMPAVLVEIGFMTNAADVAALKTASVREKAALGLFNGIVKSLTQT